jgi:hypothetical protein
LPFAPLEDQIGTTNPKLADIDGLPPTTVAILENAGYSRLDDILDLEREDFLKLAGIMIEDADRLMSIIDELTMDAPDEDVAVDVAVDAVADVDAGAGAGANDEATATEPAATEMVEPAPEPPADS